MDSFADYSTSVYKTMQCIDPNQVEDLVLVLYEAYLEDRAIFIIGNGGSAANASHFAQDLAKGTRVSLKYPRRVRALSLTDNTAFISALGNDDGYDRIFEQQLQTYSRCGDVLIAISVSGNSPNIIRATHWANSNRLLTVGVTGFNGGTLRGLSQKSIHVPLENMCTCESIHSTIFHYIVLALTERLKSLVSDKPELDTQDVVKSYEVIELK